MLLNMLDNNTDIIYPITKLILQIIVFSWNVNLKFNNYFIDFTFPNI